MKNSSEVDELKTRIALLQDRQKNDLAFLKDHFHETCEGLKPINLLKNSFKEVVASPDVKSEVLKGAGGLAAGYLSKKILIGSSHNPIKRILGGVLEFIVANVVAKRINVSGK